jgi:hypothetical protein
MKTEKEDATARRESLHCPPPNNLKLPFFSYGIFKSGELAYQRLRPYVEGAPMSATVNGVLWLRDGLPLLEQSASGTVRGCLLGFRPSRETEAYRLVSETEPANHYEWAEMEVALADGSRLDANALAGRDPQQASSLLEGEEWTGREDPVLTYAIELIRETSKNSAGAVFESAPPESFDWPRFFRLQMAYLLLWSAIERYAALAYGPNLKPMQKLRAISEDAFFAEALRGLNDRTDEVFDSRDPKSSYKLDVKNPWSSANYYYQVRSNMSHRGKGAWRDGEVVRQSLTGLLEIFEVMLARSWKTR